MNTKRFLIFAMLTFLKFANHLMQAQNAPFALWSAVVLNTNSNKKLSNTSDFGYRTISKDFISYQTFIRTGMRYNISSKLSFIAGVGLFNTKTSFLKENHEFGHEFRIFQDLNHQSSRTNKLLMDYRFRLEEKFFEMTSKKQAYFGWRGQVRLLVGIQISKKITMLSGGEYMESLIKNHFALDQIRIINSLAYKVNRDLILSFMYMYNHRITYHQNIFNFTIIKNIHLNDNKKPQI